MDPVASRIFRLFARGGFQHYQHIAIIMISPSPSEPFIQENEIRSKVVDLITIDDTCDIVQRLAHPRTNARYLIVLPCARAADS